MLPVSVVQFRLTLLILIFVICVSSLRTSSFEFMFFVFFSLVSLNTLLILIFVIEMNSSSYYTLNNFRRRKIWLSIAFLSVCFENYGILNCFESLNSKFDITVSSS